MRILTFYLYRYPAEGFSKLDRVVQKWDSQYWQIANLEGSSRRLWIRDHSRIDLIHCRQISDVYSQLHSDHQVYLGEGLSL
jgi:hypothetical protein